MPAGEGQPPLRQLLQAILTQLPQAVAQTLAPPSPEAGLPALLQWLPPPPRLAPMLNPQIDAVMHRLAESMPDERLRALVYVVDGLLHTHVEMTDQLLNSMWKFARFNLPKILGLRGPPAPRHRYE